MASSEGGLSPLTKLPGTRSRRGEIGGMGLPGPRWAWILALSAIGAAILYLLRPGVVTDDTYAFLDWGRDLRHDYLPLLEQRTFQPLPIAAAAIVSLFGSAAPTVTILLCLASLFSLAAAAWRVTELLDFPQPAPLVAAVLIVGTPVLPVLALVAYNNLPFAMLVVWALVMDMEERRTGAWVLLMIAGVTRPEAWLFLIAYGVLDWWRAGRPLAPARWLPIAALALAPLLVWAALEWALFGDPLYSLHHTSGSGVQNTHTNTLHAIWGNIRANIPTAGLIAAGVGIGAIAWLSPRRLAGLMLGLVVLTLISLGVLAGSKFNVPGRDFSVLIALLSVCSAAGAALPARLLVASRGARAPATLAAGLAGAALLIGFSVKRDAQSFRGNFLNLKVSYATSNSFTDEVTADRSRIDVTGARRHSVAMLGAVDNSELAWVLGVPFNVVTEQIEPQTRLIVQPSPHTWSRLEHRHLTDRPRITLPAGWRVLSDGSWEVFVPDGPSPDSLR